jgi:hypothetical protein
MNGTVRNAIEPAWRRVLLAVALLCGSPARAETTSATAQNPVAAKPLDIGALPELPVVWSHPAYGTQPLRRGNLVLAIAPGMREVVALDAQTGVVRWRVGAPEGAQLSSLIGREAGALWVSGHRGEKAFVARIDHTATRGQLVASLSHEDVGYPDPVDVGVDLALRNRGRCVMRVLDGNAGKLLPQLLRGHHIERFSRHGPPHSSCEVTSSVHLYHGPRRYVVASDYRGRQGLQALDEKNQTGWSLPGRYFRLLHADGETAVFYSYLDQGSRLLRIRLSSGEVLWQSELKSTCDSDGSSRHAQVMKRKDAAAVVLIQDCEKARLVELLSGKQLWQKPHAGTLSVLADAEPVDLGSDGGDSFSIDGRGREISVRWLHVNGDSSGSVKLPKDTREVSLVPGGVVAHNQALDQVFLLRRDGSEGFRAAIRFGNAFRKDDHFIILPSSNPTVQVMVELSSGRMHKLAYDSPYVLGRAPGAAGLWLTTRRNPDAVVAVRLRSETK